MSGGLGGLIHTIIFLGILVLCFAIACSPRTRYNVLSTVFDGVPDPDFDTQMVEADSLLEIDSVTLTADIQKVLVDPFTFHTPFREKQCATCHDQNNMGGLVSKPPQLCYQCHNDADYTLEHGHGPASGGHCTTCHHPHKSENKKLLLYNGSELCFNCHNAELISNNKIHFEKSEEACVSCHNPHSSKKKFLLRSGTCSSCHDDFAEDYSFVHGPVAMGYCAECHDDHSVATENLLLHPGQKLCLECHDGISDENSPGNHSEWREKHCTECHNPHGGENRFLLN